MEENVLLDPFDVGFFGAVGVVFDTNGVTDLFEKFFALGGGFCCPVLHVDLLKLCRYNLIIN
jgi:hypothetical protein